MALNYARVDANIHNHPKIVAGGGAALHVFTFALVVNRREHFDGLIPEHFLAAAYVANQTHLHQTPGISDPVTLCNAGVTACVTVKLLRRISKGSGSAFEIVGYDEEWAGPASSKARVRKHRQKLKSGNVTVTDCNAVTPVTGQTRPDHIQTNSPPTGAQPVAVLELTSPNGVRDGVEEVREFNFEKVYSEHYPRKLGKAKGLESCIAQIKTAGDFERFRAAVVQFGDRWQHATQAQFEKCPYFSTWMNAKRWQDTEQPYPPTIPGSAQDATDQGYVTTDNIDDMIAHVQAREEQS